MGQISSFNLLEARGVVQEGGGQSEIGVTGGDVQDGQDSRVPGVVVS